ncbi:hypothetical protein JCM16303_000610 [Sporobolomyces ruberrimus]
MPYSAPDLQHCLTSSTVPQFFVWIEIDGAPVQVYTQEVKEEGKTLCYIEAIEGKEFVVRCADLRTSRPDDPYNVRIFVDGTRCNGFLTETSQFDYHVGLNAYWRYSTFSVKEISRTAELPFSFGKLQTTDDDDAACSNEEVIKHLGTIRLVYRRVKNVQESDPEVEKQAEAKPIHERSKKARLSHQAAFGEVKVKNDRGRLTFNFVDTEHYPLQVYEFRYRSRQLLQLEGMIPDTPQASPRISAEPQAATDGTGRQQGSTRLEPELETLRGEANSDAEATASGSKRSSAEDLEDRDTKKIKREMDATSAGKGKEKEVLVLSDSD